MRIVNDFKRGEVQIRSGDYLITISESGQLEVFNLETKRFVYEGLISKLFRSIAEQKMLADGM